MSNCGEIMNLRELSKFYKNCLKFYSWTDENRLLGISHLALPLAYLACGGNPAKFKIFAQIRIANYLN